MKIFISLISVLSVFSSCASMSTREAVMPQGLMAQNTGVKVKNLVRVTRDDVARMVGSFQKPNVSSLRLSGKRTAECGRGICKIYNESGKVILYQEDLAIFRNLLQRAQETKSEATMQKEATIIRCTPTDCSVDLNYESGQASLELADMELLAIATPDCFSFPSP